MHARFHHLALFYGTTTLVLLTACASQVPRSFGVAAAGPLGLITREEIESSHGTTAYEVVERARPMYLSSKLDLSPNVERAVYLNGLRLGGLSELRRIPAREVKEIRFVRAIDEVAYGVGRSGGAIFVVSKSGR
jgi:hypothetical protein